MYASCVWTVIQVVKAHINTASITTEDLAQEVRIPGISHNLVQILMLLEVSAHVLLLTKLSVLPNPAWPGSRSVTKKYAEVYINYQLIDL